MEEVLATFRRHLLAGKRVLISGGASGVGLGLLANTRFLCSPAAAFVAATTLPVDGGYVVSGF